MTRNLKLTTLGLLATLAATSLTPALAGPDSQQKNKNDWRNLAAVGAAIAGYGLLKGDSTATLLGAAGGAYAASRYETDRQHQSQDSGDNNYGYYGSRDNRHYYRTDFRYGSRPDNYQDNRQDNYRDNGQNFDGDRNQNRDSERR